jgi:hypothetical protein
MFLLLWLCPASTGAAHGDAFPDLNVNDPASLQEASRVLEEELTLAARPQTYVVVDLVTQSLRIKGHGIDLHRIPIEQWSVTSRAGMKGTFRLRARPGLVRRKLTAHATVEQDPISLADMPVHYELLFAPSMTMNVFPVAEDHPWLWMLLSSRYWWRQVKDWGCAWFAGPSGPPPPTLQLTLSAEQARSFAWSLVDAMPFVIRRTPDE